MNFTLKLLYKIQHCFAKELTVNEHLMIRITEINHFQIRYKIKCQNKKKTFYFYVVT